VGAQIKFNPQAQIAQPKFLIGKTQAQIAQVKIKLEKRKLRKKKKKKKLEKRKLQNFFQKFNKVQILQRLKKLIKRKVQISNIFK